MIPLISKISLATFPCIFFSTFHIFLAVLSLHKDEELHLSPLLLFNLWPYLFVPVRHLLCLLFCSVRCLLALSLLLRSFSPLYCPFSLPLPSSSALFFLLLPKEGTYSILFLRSFFYSCILFLFVFHSVPCVVCYFPVLCWLLLFSCSSVHLVVFCIIKGERCSSSSSCI